MRYIPNFVNNRIEIDYCLLIFAINCMFKNLVHERFVQIRCTYAQLLYRVTHFACSAPQAVFCY